MPSLILYHALISTCSQKVRFALAMKGLDYTSHLISLPKDEQLSDWYLAINPNGVVPALRDGDATIIDSSVICEYLDEVHPDVPLMPGSATGRAKVRAWMRYFEEVPTSAIRAPSFNRVFIGNVAAKGEEHNAALRARMPLRRHFYEKMGSTGFAPDVIAESEDRLSSCLARVECALSDDGPYLLGSALTLADVVLLPSVVRMEDLGMADFWADKLRVTRWYAAMQALPAFAKAYEPGARVSVRA